MISDDQATQRASAGPSGLDSAGCPPLDWLDREHNVGGAILDYPAMKRLFGEPVTGSAAGKPQRASYAPVNMGYQRPGRRSRLAGDLHARCA